MTRQTRQIAKKRGMTAILRIALAVISRFLGTARLVDELWNSLAANAQARNEMREVIKKMVADWYQRTGHHSDWRQQGKHHRAAVARPDISEVVVVALCPKL